MFMDRNSDLYLCSVMHPVPVKIATSVQSYRWNDTSDILAAITDSSLVVWHYPAVCVLDRDLVESTKERKKITVGDAAVIQSFCGQVVTVRQADGALKALAVSPYMFKVYNLVQQSRCACLHHGAAERMTDTAIGHIGSAACAARLELSSGRFNVQVGQVAAFVSILG